MLACGINSHGGELRNIRHVLRRAPKGPEVLDVIDKARGRRRTRRAVDELLSSSQEIWLEIGSGRKFGADGWTTLDIGLECDLYWDLRNGIPLPNGTVSRIYSSHLFEHLTYSEGQALMAECLRVLRPGGEFSICVPNARLYLDAYARKERLREPFLGWTPAVQGQTLIDMVNYVAYMDGHHKYMFDEESLVARLQEAAFTDTRLREFDASVDSEGRDFESIYAIARA